MLYFPTNISYLLWFGLIALSTSVAGQGLFKKKSKPEHSLQFPLETIYAEIDHNRFRELCSKITFNISSGSGDHFLSHTLNNVGIYQSDSLGPLLVGGNDPRPASGYSGWVTDPISKAIPSRVRPGEFITPSDTSFYFTSRTRSIPINIEAFIKYKSFRAGGGIGLDIMGNSLFQHDTSNLALNDVPLANNLIRQVPLAAGNVTLRRVYGYLGYEFLALRKFYFKGDVMVGTMLPGKNFNNDLIKSGISYNLGLNVRREWSEYWSLFIRPSVEQKSYTLTPPGINSGIEHRIRSFYLNAGLEYRIPSLPRCYITACRTQIDHDHGNRQYRSRVHPFTRKQNPGFGENKVRVKPNRVRSKKDGAVSR